MASLSFLFMLLSLSLVSLVRSASGVAESRARPRGRTEVKFLSLSCVLAICL